MRSDWDRYNHIIHSINSIELALQNIDNKGLSSIANGAYALLKLLASHFKNKFTDGEHGFEIKNI